MQLFRKLFDHIIYGDIKMRYNVFRKYANDVFGECDFMAQKLPKSYTIRLFRKSTRSETLKSCLLQRNDGTYTPNSLRLCALLDAWCYAPCCTTCNARGAIFLGSLASELADSLCVDYLEQVTTRRF